MNPGQNWHCCRYPQCGCLYPLCYIWLNITFIPLPIQSQISVYIYIYTYIHYITLRYVTLRYVTLRYITLHYITLHYILTYVYICIYTYMYIHMCVYIHIIYIYKVGWSSKSSKLGGVKPTRRFDGSNWFNRVARLFGSTRRGFGNAESWWIIQTISDDDLACSIYTYLDIYIYTDTYIHS